MASARPLRVPPAPTYLRNDLGLRLAKALRNPDDLVSFRAEAQAEAAEAEAAIAHELNELRTQLGQVDPLRTLGALHVFDAMRRDAMPGPANFGSDAMLDLLATVICSEGEPSVLRRIEHEFDPPRLWTIEQILNRIANHMATVEMGRMLEDRSEGQTEPLLGLLRLENAFDRMAGFDPHVRRVVTAVFSRVDGRVKSRFGFALSDSLAFASIYGQMRLVHAEHADEVMKASPVPSSFTNRDEEIQWKAGHMLYFALNAAPPIEGGPLDEWFASQLGLDEACFASLVTAMATNLGSVEPERILSDDSLRTRPLIRLSSGEWMWARPIDFLHGAMDWALSVCRGDEQLLKAFDAARQAVAEELTADLLEEVFGRDCVFRNVNYEDIESDAENDCIVSLPGLALLFETKGGRFSGPGRRAAPLRVRKHAKELVEAAANQNRRTAAAIADGKNLVAKDGRQVPVVPSHEASPIVVTLDRVDPFSTYLGQPTDAGPGERNWVVNLADLLMLADILPTPEEFVAYVRMRLGMVRDGVRVFVEADCLGHWCTDRTAKVQEIVGPFGRSVQLVGETAEIMNDYFTQVALDETGSDAVDHLSKVDRPVSGIPASVLRALEAERLAGSPEWVSLVDRVAKVAPRSWRPLTRLVSAQERAAGRDPHRGLRKRVRKAMSGLTIEGQVVVTLESANSDNLKVTPVL